MKNGRWSVVALLALALCCLALPALAGDPDAGQGAMGEPDVGQTRFMTPDNERRAENGEVVYRCGTDERGPKFQFPREEVDRWIAENKIVVGGDIPVYVHVIYTAREGNVPLSQIQEQIDVLNNTYDGRDYDGVNPVPGAASTGYNFILAGTDYTKNSKWFRMTPGSGAEIQAKNALAHQPLGAALNIYVCKPGQNLLGWAVFPWDSRASGAQDGVVIHYGSLPGGYLAPYDLGGTATHEVGHWLGLYHTFQGGCGTSNCLTSGDLVCDTPAEGTATSGCPSGKDTCPAAGLDPIDNYMDYSTDDCYTKFTPDQDTRMNEQVTGNSSRSWIGSTRIANVEQPGNGNGHGPDFDPGERRAENGEVVYRCATDERGPKVQFPREQVDRWIAENKIVVGGDIPVYVHVIHSGNEGNVSLSQIQSQITVLNNTYDGRDYNGLNPVPGAANTGYNFVLAGYDYTRSNKWFRMTPGSGAEIQAKNTLAHRPLGVSLNIYVCKPGQNLLGWAVFPWDSRASGAQDGVVIHYGSLPGGYLAPYDLGGTATHEVGHWLGLYHTFQGGCGTSNCLTSGDLVCDTPAEGTATSGCPSGKDTCPAAGLDPIDNYMDYSTDDCYTKFTPDQDTRMNEQVTGNSSRSWIGSTRIAMAAALQTTRGAADFGLRAEPNPFNPRTKIEFSLSRESHASLRIFDIRGREVGVVVNRVLPKGAHRFDFDGDRLSTGIYVMVFRAEGQEIVRRLTLLK